jgi:hypothetical protein
VAAHASTYSPSEAIRNVNLHRRQVMVALGNIVKIGRAGLSRNLPKRRTGNDLGHTANSEIAETPLNGTPSGDVSTRQEAPNDCLVNIRNWNASAARETVQQADIRSEIAGLLSQMTTQQLTLARASLIQILDADQVSNLENII